MAQYRQSGAVHNHAFPNGLASDHVSIALRGAASRHLHHRRSKPLPSYRILIGFWLLAPILILSFSAVLYFSLHSHTQGGDINRQQVQDNEMVAIDINTDFLTNVTRTQKTKDLKFGHESVVHGWNSHYWDGDDRSRDDDYTEEKLEQPQNNSVDKEGHNAVNSGHNKSSFDKYHKITSHQGNGLYNEAGRHELKLYEAEYEANLKDVGMSTDVNGETSQQSGDNYGRNYRTVEDADEYDDGMDFLDDPMEEYDDAGHGERDHASATIEIRKSSHTYPAGNKSEDNINEAYKASNDLHGKDSPSETQHSKGHTSKGHVSVDDNRPGPKLISEKHAGSKKKSKRRKFSGTCEMKTMNSTLQMVEPVESRKFVRFSLQYTEKEEKPIGDEEWEARFAGHQSLKEREESFLARDQKINCGFVKGPAESPSTGFDIAEGDANYLSSCHIAVMSCIFGNSDRLRSPHGKMVTRFSRKNVCFVMFVDEVTLQTLSSEGHMPDMMGFLGLWKVVVVKNLPYTDMRRVGKIPKFLAHRIFSSARYSIWLDSKLRLQLDPLVILEYFLWRKGYEYAISNHYDRHCLWDEVEQNKKLKKYNHSVIDEQFAFYQADGMRRFNPSDPNKLLPSNVPEGSVIVRAHTPMSNLFSCLWFNEVDRFTPRDQLSFAYTYHKLRWMNPDKPFYLHMFKDCERRRIAKLYHHRTDERRHNPQ